MSLDASAGAASPLSPGYGWRALLRHVPQSVVLMRRVTREMQAVGIEERWRFIAIAVTSVVMAAESTALETYAPDAFFDAWRAGYGASAVLAGVFIGYAMLGIVAVYAIALVLHVTFRVARRGTAFADMRTAMASSGYPQIMLSLFNLAVMGAAVLAGEERRGAALSVIEASLLVATALAIGYGVVALSAATGTPTLQVLGLQVIAALGTIAVVAAVAWTVGLVL